jgi:isochorismate hydrolase
VKSIWLPCLSAWPDGREARVPDRTPCRRTALTARRPVQEESASRRAGSSTSSTAELETLYLDPMLLSAHTAFVVIDMQRDFVVAGAPAAVDAAEACVGPIPRFAQRCRDGGGTVVWVTRAYASDGSDVERARRTRFLADPFVVAGTPGAELVNSLQPHPDDVAVVKPRWSAFFGTELDAMVAARGIDHVVIAGTTSPAACEPPRWTRYRSTLQPMCSSAESRRGAPRRCRRTARTSPTSASGLPPMPDRASASRARPGRDGCPSP